MSDVPETQNAGDYVWHFKLLDDAESPAGDDDAVTDMVRRQVSALLRCVRFTRDGHDLTVTGFRLLGDPDREHRIRPSLDAHDCSRADLPERDSD